MKFVLLNYWLSVWRITSGIGLLIFGICEQKLAAKTRTRTVAKHCDCYGTFNLNDQLATMIPFDVMGEEGILAGINVSSNRVEWILNEFKSKNNKLNEIVGEESTAEPNPIIIKPKPLEKRVIISCHCPVQYTQCSIDLVEPTFNLFLLDNRSNSGSTIDWKQDFVFHPNILYLAIIIPSNNTKQLNTQHISQLKAFLKDSFSASKPVFKHCANCSKKLQLPSIKKLVYEFLKENQISCYSTLILF